jgi:hypothetical protein
VEDAELRVVGQFSFAAELSFDKGRQDDPHQTQMNEFVVATEDPSK